MITQKKLKEILEYRGDGHLYWIVKKARSKTNVPAGSEHTVYRKIQINNKGYFEHRLIWLYFNGKMPIEIDHIDQNPKNNHINNLREVSHTQNLYNKRKYKNSTSRYVGVHWNKAMKKWCSQIKTNIKNKTLGYFDNEIDAAKRRDDEIIKVGCQYCTLNIKKEEK